jgi:hypothetical protein
MKIGGDWRQHDIMRLRPYQHVNVYVTTPKPVALY